jgi:hypothetical protein
MPDAKRSAGPGKATTERREAATEREELEELITPDDDDDEGNYTGETRAAESEAQVSGRDNQGSASGSTGIKKP